MLIIIYDIKCLNALLIFFFYFMKTRFTQVQSLKKGRQLEIDEITLTSVNDQLWW